MVACIKEAQAAGVGYPRTCPTCKLGPCQKTVTAKPDDYNVNRTLRVLFEEVKSMFGENFQVITEDKEWEHADSGVMVSVHQGTIAVTDGPTNAVFSRSVGGSFNPVAMACYIGVLIQ